MVVVTAPELCRRIHAVDGESRSCPSQRSTVGNTSPLISPIFVYALLARISGIPILERRADQRWGDDPDYQAYKGSDTHFSPVLKPFGSFVASKPPDMSDDRQPPADMSVTRPLPNRCLMTLPLSPRPPTPPGRLAFGEGAFPHSTLSGIALRTSTPVDSRASRHLHRVGGSPKNNTARLRTPHKYVYRRG